MLKKLSAFFIVILIFSQTIFSPISVVVAQAQALNETNQQVQELDNVEEQEDSDASETNRSARSASENGAEDENNGSEEDGTEGEETPAEDQPAVDDKTPEEGKETGKGSTEEKVAGKEGSDSGKSATEDEAVTEEEDKSDSENITAEEEDAVEASDENVEDEEVEVEAASVGPQADLGNIFTSPKLTLNGEELEDGDIIDIDANTIVQLEYQWHTEELDVSAGDTASIQLSDVFRQVNVSNQPVITGGVEVGTYSITDGVLTLTFNANIEDGNVSNGVVGLNLNFDMEKFEENIKQVIEFNDRDENTLTVTARPSGDISGITKEGRTDRDMNAREITWTIDVMNDNDESIDGILEDLLPEGLGAPRDFVINELSVGLHGNKQVGNEVDFDPQVDGNKFSIEFGEIAPFNGYRVQYTTTIEDYSIDNFTNDATFSYGDTELSADATVFAGNRSNPIEKSGEYDWNTGQIDWTIIVNESGGEIDEAIVYDTLPDEQELVAGSIEVSKFDSNWNSEESVNIDETDFPINLGKIESDEIYQIKFSTNIDWSEVNGGEYQHQNQFTNKTELNDGNIKVGEDEATVDHWRDTLLEKTGASNVNYDNNTLTWTVEVNKANHPLSNVVVNDVIPDGLSISEDDIVITGEDGESYEANINVDGQNVRIDLGDIGSETIKIVYTTTIEDFTIDDFNNAATLQGDGIGEEDHGDKHVISPPANSFAKDFKGINYNERTMDWSLTVNPIREAITELTIVDTFPNKGMILLPDTLVVKVGGEEVETGFTLTPNAEDDETGYHKGFTIEFDEPLLPLNAQMEITYQTSYDPQREVDGNTLDPHVGGEGQTRVYENHAQFTGETEHGNEFDTDKDAEETVREDSWNSGKKEGKLVHEDTDDNLNNGWVSGSERKIAWELYTNFQEQNLGTGVVITDTLDYEGTIDEDSVTVTVYNVDANGNTTITDNVLSDENYTVNYNGDSFTLTFNDDFTVDERYVIQYTTTVPNTSQPSYENGATVTVGEENYPYSGTVNYEKHNDFLEKGTVGVNNNEVFTGDEVEWQVTVNESLSIIQNAVITDTISNGLVYVENSLSIATASGTDLVEDEDYTLEVTETDDGETVLKITLSEDLTEVLVLNYTTVVTETDGQVNNTIELNGENIEEQTISSEQLSARQFSWVGGDFSPNRGAIKLEKFDAEEEVLIENNEATFALWYELNGERVQYTQAEAFRTENGVLEIGNLPIRTYYLTEVESPKGYELSEEEVEITVVPFGSNKNYYEVKFENTKEKIDVTGTKEWQGGESQRPDSIELQLYRDGEAIGDPVTLEDGETEYTWSDLDRTDIDGNAYEYTVDEVEVPTNFEKSISDDGLTVTNTFTSSRIDIPVKKEWDDANNQDGNRPESIEVALFANSNEADVDNIILDNGSNWQGEFTNLPEFDNSGSKITYTVEEVEVPEGYESNIAGDVEEGFVITNSYTPSKIDIPVEKVWEDANNQDGKRPNSITVNLLADSEPTGQSKVLNESNSWEASFTDLDEYQDGSKIDYTVEESNVPVEYESDIAGNIEDGYTITNSYTPEATDIIVEKVWDDANDQDGVRPDSITIHLYDDRSNVIETVEITADQDGNWSYVFENLPKYRDGLEIVYSVAEDTVEDYSTSISNNGDGTFTVTNEHTPEQTSVTVNKFWDDENNQDGLRPNHIKVQLLADGEPEGSEVIVTAADGWSYTWTELDANRDGGEAIVYSVEEVDVPADYESTINDENHGAITITNSRKTNTIDIPVEKAWEDGNNQDGNRPENITVRLIDDLNQVVATQEITPDEDGNWTHVFEGVPENREGNPIEYRVVEDAIDGYSTKVTKRADGFVITNSYTPEQTSLTVIKGWNDGNNQDGVRPNNVTVQLFADGEAEGNPVLLSEENDWSYIWSELDVYADGEAIKYTVEEETIPEGYDEPTVTENNGNILITNNRTPDTVDIPVEKIWEDADNQDGVRPESVTVQVINDRSEIVATTELNESNNWQHIFEDLPRNRAEGQEISYRVTEKSVPAYSTSIEGNDVENVVITNAYTPEETSVTVTKGWSDADNQDGIRPEQIEVQLYADNEPIRDAVVLSAENDWMHTWTELGMYRDGGVEVDYTVKEVSVPEGYEVIVNDEDHGNIILTNHHAPEQVDIAGSKTWEDADNQDGIRPESIIVNLMANGTKVDSIEVTAEDDWNFGFTDLPKNEAGEEIEYTIQEEAVDGYDVTYEGYDITNSYTPEVIDVEGEKVWNDGNNHYNQRPNSITVNLLANGKEVDSVEVTAETDWAFVFTDVPKFAAGEEITYTIQEEATEGYVTESVTGNATDGFTITNRPAKVSVGDYVWFDENRDGLQDDTDIPVEGVVLTLEDENGNPVTDVYGNPVGPTTTDEDGWYTFDNLPIDNTYVVKIDREASKEVLRGYEPTLHEIGDDNTVDSSTWEATSRHLTEDEERDPTLDFGFVKSKKVSVGDYVWIDVNRDGLQDDTDIPLEGVVLELVDENGDPVTNVYGEPVGPTTTDENGWYTFENLPADNTYTVRINREKSAEALQDYEPTLEGAGEDNTIDSSTWEATSRHLTEDEERDPTLDFGFVRVVTDLSGSKTWDDADNQDGKRPDSITVNLLANGKEVASVEVTADTDWTFEFTNQPKLENGEEIIYTVQEENVEGYSAAIDGMNITNSYTPEQTSINVVKQWNDGNYKEVRPDSITVNLLADGEKVDSAKLNESNNWQADFTELDIFANGKEITYTVVEEEVPGYVSSVDVKDSSNIVIVNSPAKVSVGDYVWFDDNKDGIQDESEEGIPGVVLIIQDKEGNPVTDVYGNPVGPTTTDENGYYIFENLPADKTYIVRIDREASAKVLEKYIPTLHEVGDDNSIDSSTWFAVSRHLVEDGEHDPTLDFGFIIPTEPEEPVDPEDPTDPKDPSEPEKPGEPGDSDPSKDDTPVSGEGSKQDGDSTKDEDKSGSLPDTATNTFNIMLIGAGILLLGLILYMTSRRARKNN